MFKTIKEALLDTFEKEHEFLSNSLTKLEDGEDFSNKNEHKMFLMGRIREITLVIDFIKNNI